MDAFAKTAGTNSIFGYYDVNTLQLAVDSRGYELNYFDARKNLDELPLEDNSVLGVLINISTPLLYFFKSRHWHGIRKVFSKDSNTSKLYFMDSKLRRPQEMDFSTARDTLADLRTSGAQILVLMRKREDDAEGSARADA